jgi:glyoxylase-like metal-dependent hydrolase (beta-lactamase superfamily II)/rhodanese-related sulfurtransferase
VILQQFYLKCLAHASYIVADETSGAAVVVDPQRDVDIYIDFARERHLTIAHVVLTHLHADFVAGHLELRDRAGAMIHLGKAAHAEYAFAPLGDGDAIELGRVRLEAIETPGHTPESICLLVFDRDASDVVPQAVLTGDTLFVGDVGRPDLRASLGWSAEDLGTRLYASLHEKLLRLPDTSLVYPAHGAGSLCGKALGNETFTTIGEQRRVNYALQPMTERQFVDLVTADQPDAPAYFTYDAVLNTRERPTLGDAIQRELKPLSLDQVLTMQSGGAQILDTRESGAFAAAHLKGSINIGLSGQYATWAGTILDPARQIVIVCEPGAELESEVRLGRIGFDNVAGYLRDGMAALADRPELMSATLRLGPSVAQAEIASGEVVPLDVRTPAEYAQRSIAGSIHMPLSRLAAHTDELPTRTPLLLFCAGGYRSSIAASVLESRGFDVRELAGGIAAWEQAGLPIASAS